jgi:hypothetical protein
MGGMGMLPCGSPGSTMGTLPERHVKLVTALSKKRLLKKANQTNNGWMGLDASVDEWHYGIQHRFSRPELLFIQITCREVDVDMVELRVAEAGGQVKTNTFTLSDFYQPRDPNREQFINIVVPFEADVYQLLYKALKLDVL